MNFDNYFNRGIRYNLINTDDDYAYDVIAAFISWGIKNNKKCYYFVDRDVVGSLEFYLRKFKIDLLDLVAGNNLVIQSSKDFFINDNIDYTYDNIISLVKHAVEDGYNGIAIISDREMYCRTDYDEQLVYNYEKQLDSIFEKYPVSVISCYNIDKFGVDALFAITHLNPNFIYKNNDEVFVHIEGEPVFTQQETLGIVQEFLKRREKIIRENKVYKFISKLSGELSYKKDEGEILETAINIICSSISANRGFVVLFGSEDDSKMITYNMNQDIIDAYKYRIGCYDANVLDLFQKLNCIVHNINDVEEDIKDIMIRNNIVSYIIIPIKFNQKILGCMWLSSQDKYFSFDDNSDFCVWFVKPLVKCLLNIEDIRRYRIV